MACYLISYDLRKAKDYERLYEAINSYGTWAHVLESSWVVVTDKTATNIRDHLSEYIDSDDALFIVKSAGEAAWRNVLCKNEWLKEHL